MDDNSELINLYISKQRALIDDLQTRLLLSETKLNVTEGKLANLIKQYEALANAHKEPVKKSNKS